jgi:hypothetical protein
MIWKNGLTSFAKYEQGLKKQKTKEEALLNRLNVWQRKFAWFPVEVGITDDAHSIKAWLEFVRVNYHAYYTQEVPIFRVWRESIRVLRTNPEYQLCD